MKYSKLLVRTLAITLGVALIFSAFVYRWQISDWWTARNYTPSAAISTIVSNTTMTHKATRIFYASKPQLQDKASFNTTLCARENSSTLVLGCYEPDRGIFILKVTDPRLDGEIEVTAAHEMLHAVYQRLSSREKAHLNQLLEAQFSKITDERIKKLIDIYKTTEPTAIDNEMHSIFGTEVRSLSPELEEHYKSYFTNRLKIVAYSEAYQQVFLDIRSQVQSYDDRLETLKKTIDANKLQLASLQNQLITMRSQLEAERSSGDISGYNAGVVPFNAKVSEYNALITTTTELVETYNTLVGERNAIALEQRDLVQALDSKSIDTAAP